MISSIYSFYNKRNKLDKMFNYACFQIESSIELFYLTNGFFPKDYSQVTKYMENNFNSSNRRYWEPLIDPFTNEYYKIIFVENKIKERSGVLIISAGLNGEINNSLSSISSIDVDKLNLVKTNINKFSYNPSLLDYFYSSNDIVMGYYCHEFSYLEGTSFTHRTDVFRKFKRYNSRRIFLKAKLQEHNINLDTIKLSLGDHEIDLCDIYTKNKYSRLYMIYSG